MKNNSVEFFTLRAAYSTAAVNFLLHSLLSSTLLNVHDKALLPVRLVSKAPSSGKLRTHTGKLEHFHIPGKS